MRQDWCVSLGVLYAEIGELFVRENEYREAVRFCKVVCVVLLLMWVLFVGGVVSSVGCGSETFEVDRQITEQFVASMLSDDMQNCYRVYETQFVYYSADIVETCSICYLSV